VGCGAERRRERNGWFWSFGVLVLDLYHPSTCRTIHQQRQAAQCRSDFVIYYSLYGSIFYDVCSSWSCLVNLNLRAMNCLASMINL
jgi:hypothetical protein